MPFPYLKTFFIAILLVSVTILANASPPSETFSIGWIMAIGRGHPALLHLPIGLLAAVALAELFYMRQGQKSVAIQSHLLEATFASILVVVVCGIILSWEGGYNEESLSNHTIGALVVAYLVGIAYICAPLGAKSHRMLYKINLAASIVAMVYTGHQGGSLTHGSDFLTEHLPFASKTNSSSETKQSNDHTPTLFEHAILPNLDTYCIRCHGAEKDKGDLRLDTYPAMLAGGEIGEAVVPGDSVGSLLIEFMALPLDHDDHMPPEGKLQPGQDIIELFTWWIDSGASSTATIEAFTGPDSIAHFFALPTAIKPLSRQTIETLLKTNSTALEPFAIEFLSKDDERLSISSHQANDQNIEALRPLTANIARLDLSRSPITNQALNAVVQFLNLTELRLAKTSINDQGAVKLNKLKGLQTLDLANTDISDDVLSSFASIPSLKFLNLQATRASAKNAAILQKRLFPNQKAEQLQKKIDSLHQEINSLGLKVETSEEDE